MKEGYHSFLAERGARVCRAEHGVPESHVHPVATGATRRTLSCLEHRIGSVLYELQNLAIAIPARQHTLLDAVVFLHVIRASLIGT